MSSDAHPLLPPHQSLARVTDQLARIPLHFPAPRRWAIALGGEAGDFTIRFDFEEIVILPKSTHNNL